MSVIRKSELIKQLSEIDTFRRSKVSDPVVIFDSKLLHDDDTMLWDDVTTSGSANSTYLTNEGLVELSVDPSVQGRRTRRTRRYISNQSGKSQSIYMAGSFMTADNGVIKRIGLFDDDDGIFFIYDDTGIGIGTKSSVSGSVVENITYQSSWNLDKLDGTGKSGISINSLFGQIFIIDYQWISFGMVRWGFIINGDVVYVHTNNYTNNSNNSYIRYPDLPLSFDIVSDGTGTAGNSVLRCMCSTVVTEGAEQKLGISRHISMRNNLTPVLSDDTFVYPLLSLRFQSGKIHGTIVITRISAICTSNSNFEVILVANPTLDNNVADGAIWNPVPLSNMEYDFNRSLSNNRILDDGTLLEIDGFHVSVSGDADTRDMDSNISLGVSINGDIDEIVLCIRKISGGNENYTGSLTFKEIN